MTTRRALVLADDGLITQLQTGDNLPASRAVAQLLIQNNAMIRLLVSLTLSLDAAEAALSDGDIESFISEMQS